MDSRRRIYVQVYLYKCGIVCSAFCDCVWFSNTYQCATGAECGVAHICTNCAKCGTNVRLGNTREYANRNANQGGVRGDAHA